jgi:hypothetical protein
LARPEIELVRDLLEGWLATYPDRDNPAFLGRLRSKTNSVFRAAFFEMYVYRVTESQGYQLKLHPQSDAYATKRPDFLVLRDGEELFFLEATSSGDPITGEQEELRRALRPHPIRR